MVPRRTSKRETRQGLTRSWKPIELRALRSGLLRFESARDDDVGFRHALRFQGGVDLPAEGGRIVLDVDDQHSAGSSQPRHAVDGEQTGRDPLLERGDVAAGWHGPSEPWARSRRNRHTMNTTSRSSSTSSMWFAIVKRELPANSSPVARAVARSTISEPESPAPENGPASPRIRI